MQVIRLMCEFLVDHLTAGGWVRTRSIANMEHITYEQAQAKVLEYVKANWGFPFGTPHVGDDGWEDHDGYLVPYGAKEFLVDEDLAYGILNDMCLIVNKHTGLIEEHNVSLILDRINAMTPVTPPRETSPLHASEA